MRPIGTIFETCGADSSSTDTREWITTWKVIDHKESYNPMGIKEMGEVIKPIKREPKGGKCDC